MRMLEVLILTNYNKWEPRKVLHDNHIYMHCRLANEGKSNTQIFKAVWCI